MDKGRMARNSGDWVMSLEDLVKQGWKRSFRSNVGGAGGQLVSEGERVMGVEEGAV